MQDHKLKEKKRESPAPTVPTVDNADLFNLSLKDLKEKLLKSSIYRCTIKGCMFKFQSPERRDIHLKCHSSYSKVREFKCFECFEKQKGWRHCCMHLWKVHHVDVDLLRCPICPFKAQNTVKIFQHLQIHGGNKGFPCLVCTKVFPNYCQLRRHSLSHLDIQKNSVTRWYSQKTCQICLNVFANSKTLTKHMKRHNKIVSYRCNICNKGSTNKATWLIHMRQHTGKELNWLARYHLTYSAFIPPLQAKNRSSAKCVRSMRATRVSCESTRSDTQPRSRTSAKCATTVPSKRPE